MMEVDKICSRSLRKNMTKVIKQAETRHDNYVKSNRKGFHLSNLY